jgi:hypothetical protein
VKETVDGLIEDLMRKSKEAVRSEGGKSSEDLVGLNRCFMLVRNLTSYLTLTVTQQMDRVANERDSLS